MKSTRRFLLAGTAFFVMLALSGCTYGTGTRETSPSTAIDVLVDSDEDAVQIAAMTVLNTYATPAESKDAWLQSLSPLVSADYYQSSADTQPPQLQTVTITATSPEAPATGEGDQVRVKIGSDTGSWFVVMVRADKNAPWLAASITPASTT